MRRIQNLSGLFLLAVLMFGLQAVSYAGEEAYQVIGHAELKAKVDADQRSFLLVDSRNPEEYREAHIPGAINIPQKEMAGYLGLLPAYKSSEIIFYCNGVKCGKSRKAAKVAADLGYGNIRIFAEGMPVWEEMGYAFFRGADYEAKIETSKIAPGDLQGILAKDAETVTVVDVRDPEEFNEGHIPGAVNLPLKNFAAGSGVLDKEKTIVVYCNSGGRSYGAYKKLVKLGYKNIRQAIFADWKDAGLPVES